MLSCATVMRLGWAATVVILLVPAAAADEGTFECDMPTFTPVHAVECVFVERTSSASWVTAFESPRAGCYLVAAGDDPNEDAMYRDPVGEAIPASYQLYLACPFADVVAAGGVPVGFDEAASLSLVDATANATGQAPGNHSLAEVGGNEAPLPSAAVSLGVLGLLAVASRRS